MKVKHICLVSMLTAAFAASPAMGKSGLSVEASLSFGSPADKSKMILIDGYKGISAGDNGPLGSTGADFGLSTIMSQHYLMTIRDAEIQNLKQFETFGISAEGSNIIDSVTEASLITSIDLSASLRYDFLGLFFARAGYNRDVIMTKGGQEFTLGPLTSNSLFEIFTGVNCSGTISQKYNAAYQGVPITLGINLPIKEGRYNIYAGTGPTWYTGFWSVRLSYPANYIFLNGEPIEYDIDDTVKFETSGIALNWMAGADIRLVDDFYVFMEYSETIAEDRGVSFELESSAMKGAFGADRIFDTVNLSKSGFRLGLKYLVINN